MADAPAAKQDPVALVTGAGSGIGRALCALLAQERYRLALVGRDASRLDETIHEIGRDGHRELTIAADISRSDEAARAVDAALSRFGRLDALINNAGMVCAAPIEQTTQELLERTFAVNVFGPAHLIARAWPAFLRQRGGCVINVSSMSAADPFPGLSVYGAAKSALEGFTRGIVNEGGDLNIRAFTVAPGAVETAMLRSLVSESDLPSSATLDPKDVAQVVVDCVLGRRDADIGHVIRMERSGKE